MYPAAEERKEHSRRKKMDEEKEENVGLRETHGIELHGAEKEEPQPDPRSALIWPARSRWPGV